MFSGRISILKKYGDCDLQNTVFFKGKEPMVTFGVVMALTVFLYLTLTFQIKDVR